MKKLTLFIIASLLSGICIHAQDFSREWGRISQKEVDLKIYDKDPDANAVVLYDIGQSEFIDTDEGYSIQFTRTKKVKVLSQAGISQAEIKVPYYVDGYGKTEIIRKIEAYSYNYDDGNLSKKPLEEVNIFDEIINERWRAKKFVMPDVKEGTIIEYRIILETPFHFNLPDWTFQDKIPTIYSKYTVKMIPFYEYIFIAQGISRFTYQNAEVATGLGRRFGSIEFKDMVYTYVMENVPAFYDEAYITSIDDYLIKIDFQLSKFHSPNGSNSDIITTWEDLNESLLKHADFGKYIKKSSKIAEGIIEELSLVHFDDNLRAKAIVNYVKSSFSWNGFYSKYASKEPKELIKENTGNSADINLFLTALLVTAGIEAHPVIISTRDHGKIQTDYPFNHFFNNLVVIVNLDGTAFITDGTATYLSFNRVPPMCINEKGLIVNEGDIKWVDLNTDIMSINNKNIEIDLNIEDLTSNIRVTNQMTEFESLKYKENYNDDSIKLETHLLQSGFKQLSRMKTLNFNEREKPYIIAYEGQANIEVIDDKLLISPFLGFPIKENKLSQKTRSYPVDFIYPTAETFKTNIKIPDNYYVLEFPDKVEIKNELADILLQYSMRDNILTVIGEYTFKHATYQANEYARIKYYLDTIVKKFNAQIVLAKSEQI